MNFLLGTNACIVFLNRPGSGAARQLKRYHPERIALWSVVKAELFYGAIKSRWPERNLEKLRVFMSVFSSLPFDGKAAGRFGEIRAALQRKGAPIGPYDLQIAATALAHGSTLVTHNTREFSRIDGLRLADWEGLQ